MKKTQPATVDHIVLKIQGVSRMAATRNKGDDSIPADKEGKDGTAAKFRTNLAKQNHGQHRLPPINKKKAEDQIPPKENK